MEQDRFKKIQDNLHRLRERIHRACERSGRAPEDVTLVAVTKTVEPDVAGLLMDAGVEHIGENRVAEAQRKREALGRRGTWHLIGHLQRNKVRKALPLFSLIHSVDSVRLMEEISTRCGNQGLTAEILLEVNVSGEKSKHGFSPGEVPSAIEASRGLASLVLRGLMTMAPFDTDPETARPFFRRLRELQKHLRTGGAAGPEFDILSMGMTGDFEPAVEEGATHVRIGTALFEGL